MRYAGIDVATKSSAIAVVDAQGKVVHRCEVATEEAALIEALSGLGSCRVVVEASPLAEWICRVLEAAGHEPDIVDARAAKRLMEGRKKTDARDALTLAQMARTGWYQPVHRKSREARLLRSQLQARQGLVRTYKAMSAQVRGLLRAHGLRLGKTSQGQFSTQVRSLAGEQLPELLPYLEPLLAVYEQSLEEARRLKRWLDRAGREDEVRSRLQSVPGVGPLTSQVFVATLDDPGRFREGEQVADYVGLTPSVKQSGERCSHGSISREGDRLLRWHLVEAAHSLLTRGRDCRLRRWGLRLQERKGAAKARVAVARKLAVLLWRLWIDGSRFETEHGAMAA